MKKFVRSEFSKVGLAPLSMLLLAVALFTSMFVPKLLFGVVGDHGSLALLCVMVSLFLYYYFKFGLQLLNRNIFLGRVFVLSALLLLVWLILIEAAVY